MPLATKILLFLFAFLSAIYLVVVIYELQGESGVGQLHGLQQGSIGRLARLQRSLTPV